MLKKKIKKKKSKLSTPIKKKIHPEDREKLISTETAFICFYTQMKLYDSHSTITAHGKISVLTILSVNLCVRRPQEQLQPREQIMAGNEKSNAVQLCVVVVVLGEDATQGYY